jgi:hypothetical protein
MWGFDRPKAAEQPFRPRISFIATTAPELLGIVNMSIEHPGQGELASSVDHLVTRLRRKFSSLADRGNAVILDDQRAVANDPTTRVYRDDVVDVRNDDARHAPKSPGSFGKPTGDVDLNRATISVQRLNYLGRG